ncbi:dUTP diphosphatase [Cetobacterium sp.]|uniref:dUTP diphosphatase n=1 Tax=Cetobacterium sp. TaxID=2071632 RepID=UPI003F3FAC4F
MKEIKVLYHEEMPELDFIGGYGFSNAIDLYTAEDITIEAGESAMISLGVSIKLPEGYGAKIFPRSGTFKKYGLIQTNSVGIIDNTYSSKDDIYKMPVAKLVTKKDIIKSILDISCFIGNMDSDDEELNNYDYVLDTLVNNIEFNKTFIPKGTRLCQMEVRPTMEKINIVKASVEEFTDVKRGGFGEGTGV